MSIVVMQDENIFVLNLPIVEHLFSFFVDEICLDPYQFGENIKGASNLEVEVDEDEEALNLQFHELDIKELKNVKVHLESGWPMLLICNINVRK
jgi:hypothetical protein